MNLVHEIEELYSRQLNQWELARVNYDAVSHINVKKFNFNGREIVAQLNPCRYKSATAQVDSMSPSGQDCFLCSEHQPVEQETIMWQDSYKIQINPYPIFNRHLTLSHVEHRPQAIVPHIDPMMQLAEQLPGYVLFYNGPKCGASAPNHQHFQAVPFDMLPLCREVIHDDCDLSVYFPFFHIIRKEASEAKRWFHVFEEGMKSMNPNADEPPQNVLCWRTRNEWHIIIIPRSKHRPSCYGYGEDQFLLSPASVEMTGVWPIARESDFNRITPSLLQSITEEVTISENEKEQILEYFINNV